MEKQNKKSDSQAILLVWRNLLENDRQKYELFKSIAVLCRKYDSKQIGISKGALNNYISSYDGSIESDVIVYENVNVRIIKMKLNCISDFPPTDEEKQANKKKVQKRKNKDI